MMVEIGEYLYDRYVCLNLDVYKNFSFGARNTSVALTVLCCVIGAMIAAIAYYYVKHSTAPLIHALLKEKCIDEASAKTPKELGIRMNRTIRRQLRRPSPLSKLVCYVGQAQSFYVPYQDEKPINGTTAETADGTEDGAPPSAKAHISPSAIEDQEKTNGIDAVERNQKPPSYKQALSLRKQIDFETARLYIDESLTYRAEVRFAHVPRVRLLVLILLICPIAGLVFLRFFPDFLLAVDAFITFLS